MCVLDLMLPGLDGWQLIETVRNEGIGTPILVISARGSEHDRVHALELGADDYLVKPFSMKELVARVRVAARRGVRAEQVARGEPIEIEELRIDPRGRAGVRRRRERGADADRVPAPLHARPRARPRRHAGRADAAPVGPAADPPRPHGRRLHPQAAREGRPPRDARTPSSTPATASATSSSRRRSWPPSLRAR